MAVDAFINDRPLQYVPEALKLWVLFKSLGETALPVAGGLYDQHPKLIDSWFYIAQETAKKDSAQAKKRDAEARRARRRK
jgi:hypothetical protein